MTRSTGLASCVNTSAEPVVVPLSHFHFRSVIFPQVEQPRYVTFSWPSELLILKFYQGCYEETLPQLALQL